LPGLVALHLAFPSEGWLGAVRGFLGEWTAKNPYPAGDGWEPYPVARRTINWAIAVAFVPGLGDVLGSPLAAQVAFLSRNLERHLLGNHLLCDASALVAGAAVLTHGRSEAYLDLGRTLLASELRRQVLPDGGYAERTAQYHTVVLRDLLLALALCKRRGWALDPDVSGIASGMLAWLEDVRRGSSVPFLNDSAPDATPCLKEVFGLGAALGLRPRTDRHWLADALLPGKL
jgi:hypothetical protein